jgi:Radical SAM superfamily
MYQPPILFITPPFTQLNTPYPATAYLKGFLETKGIASFQCDLGIEVILQLFSKKGLTDLFTELEQKDLEVSDNGYRIYNLSAEYIATIDPVIRFLQNKNPTLAHSICDRTFLPEAARFDALEEMDWAFGTMGLHDKARHLATLYLEDLADLIKEVVDPHFGFSRYAERLGRTASSFDELHQELQAENTFITRILIDLLEKKLKTNQPKVVCLTVPFPGNLFGALKCGQFIKQNYPDIAVIMGGGYANTELRTLADERVFDYLDYVSLDDGEAPLLFLLEYLDGKRDKTQLKRIFARIGGVVSYWNGAIEKDIPQRETGTPNYKDLLLNDYLSVIEIVNPMHRLWSDGRWNKLTLAHGCYWGKCSFCDVSLDYIARYEPVTASLLCDRIEEIIEQTQQTGFHFVDEAAPPALMRDLALEIIRRKLTVTWWTNIRFEKSFTPDLSRLLKASGCIAISGGLEVASDRLLELMKKGVTVAQVAQVTDGFTKAGILVHAYLMYGFPTQTAQETIDSLEVVRQLFENGVLQSGFWHRFAMTSHSPVGLDPAAFDVVRIGPEFGGFADNDLFHEDPKGANHDLFAEGLRKSLFNYMHEVGIDFPLADWFNFKTPRTTVKPNYIANAIATHPEKMPRSNALVFWLGNSLPLLEELAPTTMQNTPKGKKKAKKRADYDLAYLTFFNKKTQWTLETSSQTAAWLCAIFPKLQIVPNQEPLSLQGLKMLFEEAILDDYTDFQTFLDSFTFSQLRENGLVLV